MTRGDIYWIRLPARRGREQAGARYAVIVQADELLGLLEGDRGSDVTERGGGHVSSGDLASG